jgi:F0F1-type ATP synthase epsilon subunit
MTPRITLKILTPDSMESFEDLTAVSAFLTDGSIGILPGHDRLLGETESAPILYRDADGREQVLTPGPGILQVENNGVVVFAIRAGSENSPVPVRLLRNLRTDAGETGEADGQEG